MIDGIIKGDGTSRFLSGSLPATYEEFKQLVEQKKLPIDLLFNPAGWSQLPTFLNKANLFSDPTAEKYGAGVVTPDAAFSFLGQYALHWWKRKCLGYYDVEYNIPSGNGDTSNSITLDINTTLAYSKSLMINPDTGNVILAPPVSFTWYSTISNDLDKVRGSFALPFYGTQPELVPTKAIPTNATWVSSYNQLYAYAATPYYQKKYVNTEVSVDFSVPTESGGSFYTLYPGNYIAYSPALTVNKDGIVVLSNPEVKLMDSLSLPTLIYGLRGCFFKAVGQVSEYYEPTNVAATNAQISASSGNYNIMAYTASQYYSTTTKPAEWQYVQSKDRDAYPDSGEQDNYEYVYLGIPFDNAVEPAKVEVGSYTGTGSYGLNSKNTYTFSRPPKFVIILGDDDYISNAIGFYVWGMKYMGGANGTNGGENYAYPEGNQLSWFSAANSASQLNQSGVKYYVVSFY